MDAEVAEERSRIMAEAEARTAYLTAGHPERHTATQDRRTHLD